MLGESPNINFINQQQNASLPEVPTSASTTSYWKQPVKARIISRVQNTDILNARKHLLLKISQVKTSICLPFCFPAKQYGRKEAWAMAVAGPLIPGVLWGWDGMGWGRDEMRPWELVLLIYI